MITNVEVAAILYKDSIKPFEYIDQQIILAFEAGAKWSEDNYKKVQNEVNELTQKTARRNELLKLYDDYTQEKQDTWNKKT